MTRTDQSRPWPREKATSRWFPALLGAALACALFAAPAARAQDVAGEPYRLGPGDTVVIAAAGIPEFNHRVTVGIDGTIIVPLAGQMNASGLKLAELLTSLQASISTKVFRRRTLEGQEVPIVIGPEEITVTIADYRPIYVNGDVSRPGEQPFRPGLTVRSAVAVAGGYDLARFRINNPFTELADLRSEHDSLWAEHAQADAEVKRLEAELAGKASFEQTMLGGTPLPPALAGRISGLEMEKLAVRGADIRKEKEYLTGAIGQELIRARTLSEQQRQEEEGTKEDVAELARMRDLYQRGSVPSTRLTEARRSLLLSSTRSLQTGVQLAQVERERDSLSRKLEQMDDQRRLTLLDELQVAQVKLATVRAKLEAVTEKLQYTGMVRSQLVRGDGAKPEVTIIRRNGKTLQRTKEDQDYELAPGDIVEIALQSEMLTAPAVR